MPARIHGNIASVKATHRTQIDDEHTSSRMEKRNPPLKEVPFFANTSHSGVCAFPRLGKAQTEQTPQ